VAVLFVIKIYSNSVHSLPKLEIGDGFKTSTSEAETWLKSECSKPRPTWKVDGFCQKFLKFFQSI